MFCRMVPNFDADAPINKIQQELARFYSYKSFEFVSRK